jgi:hypothetical protein
MVRNLVVALSLAAGLAGCAASSLTGGDASADRQGQGTPVPVTRFGPGGRALEFYSGFTAPARLVVRSEGEWREAWARIHETRSPQPALPAVDFARETVLVAALGARSSGGHGIVVDSVYDTGSELQAVVRRTSPGAACMVPAALTQPVDAVRIPATTKSVKFVDRDEVRDCR